MLEQGVQHYRKKWMMRLYSAEHSKRVHDVLASLHYKSLSKKKKKGTLCLIDHICVAPSSLKPSLESLFISCSDDVPFKRTMKEDEN